MSSQTIGIIVGGLVPAVMYGGANLSAKIVAQMGVGVGWYIIFAGLGVCAIGALLFLLIPEHSISLKTAAFSSAVGFGWGLGTGCVVIALTRYGTPLSVLTPIFNMNTLITVLLALWLFSEWKQVQSAQLLLGTLLIVIGSVLVARA